MTPHVIDTPEELDKYSRESIEESTFMQPVKGRKDQRNETQMRILNSIKPKAREEKGGVEPKKEPKLKNKI